MEEVLAVVAVEVVTAAALDVGVEGGTESGTLVRGDGADTGFGCASFEKARVFKDLSEVEAQSTSGKKCQLDKRRELHRWKES